MGPSREALVFAAGAALGVGTVLWVASLSKRRKLCRTKCVTTNINGAIESSNASLDEKTLPHGANLLSTGSMKIFDQDDILAEQFTRNVQFFGLEGQRKISSSFVIVVGLGGVGSHAAHMLLRSGIGRLRLVDFDQVTLSSLNRHCLATRADVGLPKATVLLRRFQEILPEADIESMCEMYTEATEDMILAGDPDYVIDAIDNIDTKVALLVACRRRGIPVLCVAGAGAKADPTRLRFADVSQSTQDPLARAVRYRLRKEHGIDSGVQVLLSTERPRCGLVAPGGGVNTEDPAMLADFQVIPNFRIRTIPVLGPTPAAFGMAAASYILCELAGAPIVSAPVLRPRGLAVQTQYDRLETRERERYGVRDDALGVDVEEVEVLIRELWRGVSARATVSPPDDRSLTRGLGDLALTRWDPTKGGTIDNLVLLTREEADAHDEWVMNAGGIAALQAAEPEFVAKVEAVLARAREEFMHAYLAG